MLGFFAKRPAIGVLAILGGLVFGATMAHRSRASGPSTSSLSFLRPKPNLQSGQPAAVDWRPLLSVDVEPPRPEVLDPEEGDERAAGERDEPEHGIALEPRDDEQAQEHDRGVGDEGGRRHPEALPRAMTDGLAHDKREERTG